MSQNLDSMRRSAIWCGGGPLFLGIAIFLLWLATGWSWLMLAGFHLLWMGTLSVLVGLIAVVAFCLRADRAELAKGQSKGTIVACVMLLLVNFPVAGAIVVTSEMLFRRYRVEVHNGTGAMLHDVVLTGGGCEVALGGVAAGEEAGASIWPEHEDSLELIIGPARVRHELDVYLSSAYGGHITVEVGRDGEVRVQQESN